MRKIKANCKRHGAGCKYLIYPTRLGRVVCACVRERRIYVSIAFTYFSLPSVMAPVAGDSDWICSALVVFVTAGAFLGLSYHKISSAFAKSYCAF